jgi:hypothetical protein
LISRFYLLSMLDILLTAFGRMIPWMCSEIRYKEVSHKQQDATHIINDGWMMQLTVKGKSVNCVFVNHVESQCILNILINITTKLVKTNNVDVE